MSNILIAGDSWGMGVFCGVGDNYGPIGQGIHSILESRGHIVTNISKGGGSNGLMIERLDTSELSDVDYIIFLQTDIFREHYYYGKQYPDDVGTKWKILEQEFVDSLLTYDTLQDYIDNYFINLYSALNSYNKQIIMVGGWSQLHPSIENYENLIPAVYSATKLLIPELKQDGYLSDPEWFTQLNKESNFMRKFGQEFKQLAVNNADKLDLIYQNWNEVHPDLHGYQTIVESLLVYFARAKLRAQ
jgi:hypothetical protein